MTPVRFIAAAAGAFLIGGAAGFVVVWIVAVVT
jgi:hypothetical protein